MKLLMFLLLFTPSLEQVPINLADIAKAISKGDAAALAPFLGEDVEITVLNDINLYTKQEAQGALNAFFIENTPTKYTQVHEGQSKGAGGQYGVGVLDTKNGKYRIMIYMEKIDASFKIREIKIEKE